MTDILKPSRVRIFDGTGSPKLDIDAFAAYAEGLLGNTQVICHHDIYNYCLRKCDITVIETIKDGIVLKLADARIADLFSRVNGNTTSEPFIAYERKMLERKPPRPIGVLYDGFKMLGILGELLDRSGISSSELVVIITDQLFATCGKGEDRYHARVIMLGQPCLISTSGLMVAPARAREYYIGEQLGLHSQSDKNGTSQPTDSNTTELLKGYIAQAIFYYTTGETFCENKGCRLFDAHRQEDLLFSQLNGDIEFCEHHENIAQALKGAGNDGRYLPG